MKKQIKEALEELLSKGDATWAIPEVLKLLKSNMLEVIGEDEQKQIKVKDNHFRSGYKIKSLGKAYVRNNLRAELRKKLQELLK